MTKLIIFIVLAIVIQIILFLYSRKLKKQNREHVLTRYDIRTAKQAWDCLQDPELPEEDRIKIQEFYDAKE